MLSRTLKENFLGSEDGVHEESSLPGGDPCSLLSRYNTVSIVPKLNEMQKDDLEKCKFSLSDLLIIFLTTILGTDQEVKAMSKTSGSRKYPHFFF